MVREKIYYYIFNNFLKIYLSLFCVYGFYLHIYLCTVCVQCQKRVFDPLELQLQTVVLTRELLRGSWELNPGQLLTTEPSQ